MSRSGPFYSKTIDISFLYLQHLNIEGPSFNMQSLEYLPGSVSFNKLKKVKLQFFNVNKSFSHFESALSVLNGLDSKQPDTGVKSVHKEGPHGGPVCHALLLQVGPGAAHQPLPLLGDLLQASLQLGQVTECCRPISISKQQVLSSANKKLETSNHAGRNDENLAGGVKTQHSHYIW